MIQVVLYRGFRNTSAFDQFVGRYQGKITDLLESSKCSVCLLHPFMLVRTDDDGSSDASFGLSDKKGISVSIRMKIGLLSASTSPATSPQESAYLAIGAVPTVVDTAGNKVQQTTTAGTVVYGGLKTIMDALYELSDGFPPLKTAAAVFRTISKFVDVRLLVSSTDQWIDQILSKQTMLENKQELEDLAAKLGAILSIVEKYRSAGGSDAIRYRIADFSKFVISAYLLYILHTFFCVAEPLPYSWRQFKRYSSGQR